MNGDVSKKDKRGGARKNTGPKPSHIDLEIGRKDLADLREFCALRKEFRQDHLTPKRYLEVLCKDRIDSQYFKKELARLRLEKKLKDEGQHPSDMEF